MATITLKIVAAEMRDYNRRVARGCECAAWQDFVADCFMRYDVAPWEDAVGRDRAGARWRQLLAPYRRRRKLRVQCGNGRSLGNLIAPGVSNNAQFGEGLRC